MRPAHNAAEVRQPATMKPELRGHMKYSPNDVTVQRRGLLLLALAIAFVAAIVPHALEDFYYGALVHLGVSTSVGVAILAFSVALTSTGAALVFSRRPLGGWLLAVVGAIWSLGAILIHGHDLLFAGPHYRHGLVSRLLELLIILFGAALAGFGALFARRAML
jgi:hypothetical protein